jgi:hypothetical protein
MSAVAASPAEGHLLTSVTYVPGNRVTMTSAGGWLQIDCPPGDPIAKACWQALADGAGVETLLGCLLANGVSDMPAFALAHTDPEHLRIVVRGTALATVIRPGDLPQVLQSVPGTVWAEHLLAVSDGDLYLGSTSEPVAVGTAEIPLTGGVTTAARLHVRFAKPRPVIGQETLLTIPAQPSAQAFGVPPTMVGRLRISTGEVVPLDHDVLIGRAPRPSPHAWPQPRLVEVPSPDNDVSRNHLQVTLDGRNVYATDLGSTNGTVLRTPGRLPMRLQPNEPVLLEPRSTLILADEVLVTFEVAG